MDIGAERAGRLSVLAQRAMDDPKYPPDILERVDDEVATMRRWSASYRTPLSFDAVLERAQGALTYLGEPQRELTLSELPSAQVEALYQMGRFEEMRARFPRQDDRHEALLALGRLSDISGDTALSPDDRAKAFFLAGDAAALDALAPDSDLSWVERLESGQMSAYLAAHPRDPAGPSYGMTVHASALLAAKRYDQILQEYVHASVTARALLGLGRVDQALATGIQDPTLVALVAIRELSDGRDADAHALLARLARSELPGDEFVSAFARRLLPILIQAIDGDRAAAITALRAVAENDRFRFGQRLSYLARYAAGDIDDQAFLAQPFHLLADTRLLLAKGLRCELSGDAGGAAQHYRDLLSLPYYRTMITEDQCAFMDWRLIARGLTPPPCLPLPISP